MVTVKRALLSCYEKTGLDAFAKALAACGVELLASGGTADFLAAHGVRVKTLEAFAGITEQLGGRVKTLHPKIHAGILARRDDATQVRAVGAQGLIDLVVVNLYPFEQTIRQPQSSLADAIEQIDVGGVALLRAAAKNFAHVAAVSHPQQYASVMDALQRDHGTLPESFARALAVRAFALTSAYDARIAGYLGEAEPPVRPGSPREESSLPATATITLRQHHTLRYGENPHQQGAWYRSPTESVWGLGTLRQWQGKELSYNNLLDADAAFRCLWECDQPTCVIVKHRAPCGLASAATLSLAYERAYACDAESAFGGIVGCNRPIDAALAERLCATFLEVVMAPALAPDAVAMFAKKPNLRVVSLEWPASRPRGWEWRQLCGSWLGQDADRSTVTAQALRIVTRRAPTERERADLLFAWIAAKHAPSNAIVLATEASTVGIGQGQPSRVGSVRLAIQKAGARARGAVAASDGFFPFPDGVELLAQAGVTAVIQPGGSIRDPDVIQAADRADLVMGFTGVRHFRH